MMGYDKRITDLAAIAAAAAAKNAETAPQLLMADITFTLADAVADGRIILGPMMPDNHKALVERVSEAISDFLNERFPDGALPGGVQLFADDHIDSDFKHEAGCDALAEKIIAALQSTDPIDPDAGKHDPTGYGVHITACSKCGMDIGQMRAEPVCNPISLPR